ncbi:PAS fold-containing protein [Enhydrobacter aerosaccus]|uniref:PAS fold-containing protein n=1 Tax=Enhydrobacter aerosaccus TaxID=225324 RepID=A0A1T4TB73_9HYPH|nr:PAS domain-containing protein [Enhydrobacter aerosaccus]SKA37653.1 PAS fold-containing protein [Enhydrobacter aerosaccus]
MQRFVLRRNIQRYQELLGRETDAAKRQTMARLLIAAERDLAMMDATTEGVEPQAAFRSRTFSAEAARCIAEFEQRYAPSGKLYLLLDPGPGLPILDASDAYATATMTVRSEMRGRPLFEVFPDNPADPMADGVANLYASLRTAAQTRRPHVMPIQRYDVRDGTGTFVERHWRPTNSPMLDGEGRLGALLHYVEDVTQEVRARSP